MEDLPPAASVPCVQGCVKPLPGGIIPFLLLLQQDLATGFLSDGEYWCPGASGFGESEG